MKKMKKAEAVVYCGPDIPHVARSFTTYAEIPEALSEKIAKCPTISALIVPVSKMAETRRALKTPGTREAILYGHIQQFIKGGI
jgi:hypothetical protein